MARTLLQTVLSVAVFEEEFAKVIVKAYVKAMDKEIMIGEDSNNECVGILTEAKKTSGSRIPASNIISFTAAEMANWKTWQEKLLINDGKILDPKYIYLLKKSTSTTPQG